RPSATFDGDVAVHLADDAVHRGEAEAGARRLSAQAGERVEQVLQDVRIEAGTRVAHGQDDVVAGGRSVLPRSFIRHVRVPRREREATAVGHRLARVHGEV